MDLALFILVSIGIISIPGPNVLVVISTSISHGRVRGFQTVAGISLAMGLQLFVAAQSTAIFISSLAQGFIWLKWAGVLYLVYLGIKHIFMAFFTDDVSTTVSAIGSFYRGFWVSLTNPKTILFFSAFLPQFVVSSSPYLPQIALLSILFWSLALIVNVVYTILSSKLASTFNSTQSIKYKNGIIGAIYLGAGSLLAGAKNA